MGKRLFLPLPIFFFLVWTLCAQGSRLEHFQCYPVLDFDPQLSLEVLLTDQFDTDAVPDMVKTGTPLRFCNPTGKLHRGFLSDVKDERQHLTLYSTFPQSGPRRVVTIRNQFGNQKLIVREPIALAVPTQKLDPFHEFPQPLNHFRCYSATGHAPRIPVGLSDQFHSEVEKHVVFEPVYFCNPAQKTLLDGTTYGDLTDPAHLTCYSMTRTPFERNVPVMNQFGGQGFTLGPPDTLCVPTAKLEVALIADVATPDECSRKCIEDAVAAVKACRDGGGDDCQTQGCDEWDRCIKENECDPGAVPFPPPFCQR